MALASLARLTGCLSMTSALFWPISKRVSRMKTRYRENIFIKWRFMMAFFRKFILGETLIVGLFGLIRLIISRLTVTPERRHWLIFLPLMTLCARQNR